MFTVPDTQKACKGRVIVMKNTHGLRAYIVGRALARKMLKS